MYVNTACRSNCTLTQKPLPAMTVADNYYGSPGNRFSNIIVFVSFASKTERRSPLRVLRERPPAKATRSHLPKCSKGLCHLESVYRHRWPCCQVTAAAQHRYRLDATRRDETRRMLRSLNDERYSGEFLDRQTSMKVTHTKLPRYEIRSFPRKS